MRSPLDSWRQNEFENGFGSWLQIPVGPAHKTRLSIVGKYFLPRVWIRDRYLKISLLFCLDQLVKFVVSAQKSVPKIRALSSQMKGTITMRRPRWVDWHPETVVRVARDGSTTSSMPYSRRFWAIVELGPSLSPPSEPLQLAHVTARPSEKPDHGGAVSVQGKRERERE